MTPQERELIAELFDKLASLEKNPRDPEAEKAIAEGVRRAPHAIYPLVQTVLVQDEALKVANQRISELQNAAAEPHQSGSFLGGLFGGRSSGSVPSVRSAAPAQYAQPYQQPAAQPASGGSGIGGSFLGTAAAAAAGLVGGSLLLSGIRGLFGGGYYGGGPFAGTFDHIGGGYGGGTEIINDGPGGSPWGSAGGGDYGGGDFASSGGGDYGGGGGDYSGGGDAGGGGGFDTASNDSDFGGGFDSSDGGGGSDYA